MRHTNLVKLDPPYEILMEDWGGYGGVDCYYHIYKHIATLIEVETDDDPDNFLKVVNEYPVDEFGRLVPMPLNFSKTVGREGGSIDWFDFYMLHRELPEDYAFPISVNGPKDHTSIYYLARRIREYNVNVLLPGEEEAEGKAWDIRVELGFFIDEDKGTYSVEGDELYFDLTENSINALKDSIMKLRNEYYYAFIEKPFRIVFYSFDDDFGITEELNSKNVNTAYGK